MFKYIDKKEKKIELSSDKSKILSRLWDAIHIVGITYDPKRDKNIDVAMKCFYYAIINLLPFEVKSNSLNFLKEYPIELYLSNSTKSFQWTYLWHDYINKLLGKYRISLADASSKYSVKNLNKDIWGNAIWKLIHTLAKYLPEDPDDELKLIYWDMLKCLKQLLPCSMCREHLKKHMDKYNFKDYFHNRDTIFLYGNILHNAVNVSLKKKLMSVQDAYDLY